MEEKKFLPKKSHNISDWYLEVVRQAGFADYGPVKGTMIIKPYGYALWENMVSVLDGEFKRNGIQNVYFPLLIPHSFLKREKEHIEGFSPELALVTKAGGEDLEEPLVLRPTSETIMYDTFSNWIQSYRDLPLKINQWCNVVRWEKRTYPFLRTSEFLWQEGHTVHEEEYEALQMVRQALQWYQTFCEKVLALPVFVGQKSASERFAGGEKTYALEMVMPDGKALQGATSHYLGQKFAKVFNIQFLNRNNKQAYPYQTSWGITTRTIGGLLLVHGDDHGAIIPPRIAPVQIIILTISSKDLEMKKKIGAFVNTIRDMLIKGGFRFEIDSDLDHTLGYRMNEAEVRGIPIRIEIGPHEYERHQLIISRRDTMKKETVGVHGLIDYLEDLMDNMQHDLFDKAQNARDEKTSDTISSFSEFTSRMKSDLVFARIPWCENASCEAEIKSKTMAISRVLELSEEEKSENLTCLHCGKPARRRWLFARAY